eukprot:m.342206 g.342206  ORF g.342206 m.342206 type:complete len:76 (+) comp27847_c2_seq28:39-266(+)
MTWPVWQSLKSGIGLTDVSNWQTGRSQSPRPRKLQDTEGLNQPTKPTQLNHPTNQLNSTNQLNPTHSTNQRLTEK